MDYQLKMKVKSSLEKLKFYKIKTFLLYLYFFQFLKLQRLINNLVKWKNGCKIRFYTKQTFGNSTFKVTCGLENRPKLTKIKAQVSIGKLKSKKYF